MTRSITLCILLLAARAAADPCSFVDKDQATWAVKHITAAPAITCDACGTAKPQTVKAVATKSATWQVLVDGKSIDLATIYVQTGPKTFANVGGLVGCTVGKPFIAACPPAPPPAACPRGAPAPIRDAITGCVREYTCPP